jgi:hypothetical protein
MQDETTKKDTRRNYSSTSRKIIASRILFFNSQEKKIGQVSCFHFLRQEKTKGRNKNMLII